jgi:hypothetical protein
MKNFIKLFGIIAFAAVIGFSMAGCDLFEDNPFIGTWSDGQLTVTCTDDTWTAKRSGYSWEGTYTPDGNTANFIETNGNNFGTATVSGDTMTVKSSYGNFTLKKQ